MRVRLSAFVSVAFAALLFAAVPNVLGQAQEKGFTWYEQYGGSTTSLGQVTVLDSTVGYNFNKYFGADVGIPVHFVHPDNNLTNWTTWNNGFGDAYVDLRFDAPNPFVHYTSVVTGGAPTGSFADGFSTGRATITWDNHLEHRFGSLTPFVNAGLGNTLWDRDHFYRPYRTLGFVSQFEGGADYKVLPRIHVGASYYDVLPGGTQKIYSQIFQRESAFLFPPSVRAPHERFFETAFETTGPASIARDNGFSAWAGFSPIRNVDLEAGYTRSVRYALDVFSFRVGVNAGSFANRIMHHFF
jgi:hypothetical protein